MRLVVIGKETLEELEQMVIEMYSSVPTHNRPSPDYSVLCSLENAIDPAQSRYNPNPNPELNPIQV